MGVINSTIDPPATIKVWDPFVRIFHLSLATLFLVADLTGDEMDRVHILAGYVIAGLIALRTLWGLVGPHYACFSSFVRSPREVLTYLRDMGVSKAPRYLGHIWR
jgi:cytochrome b